MADPTAKEELKLPTRAPVDHHVANLIAESIRRSSPGPDASVDEIRQDATASGKWARGGVDPALMRIATLDEHIDGVRVRWYGPPVSVHSDIVVYFHGGGWMVGDIDAYDADVRILADRLECTVVSVEYRRTPEHPFPAPLEDCLTVIRRLAAMPHRALAVAGDSAGGNLALGAAVALAREEAIDAVLAIYPVIDPRATLNTSNAENGSGYLLTTETMVAFWDLYAPDVDSRDDPRMNLAMADLGCFPASVIATADYDPLRDEARELCARLVAADVDVTYLPHPGLTHGFQQMVPRIPAATRAINRIYDAFALTLDRAAARREATRQ